VSSRAIADTSLFIARETGRPLDPYEEDLEIAVSIVTIAEFEMGVLAATAPRIRARAGQRDRQQRDRGGGDGPRLASRCDRDGNW
jgi:predicted nucleic acid-binding protein